MYNLLYMKRNSFSCSDNKNTADQVISKLTQAALLWLPTFAIPVSCHLVKQHCNLLLFPSERSSDVNAGPGSAFCVEHVPLNLL